MFVRIMFCARSYSAFVSTSAARVFARFAFAAMTFAFAFSTSAVACCTAPSNRRGSISAITSPLCTCELKSALSLAIVPETCEPTCTFTTALTTPVASTASLISPRSTFEVRYCTRSPWRTSGAATSAASSSAAPATNIVVRLLIAQRLDRVHQRRLARRVVAEEHADGDGEERREEHALRGELLRPFERPPDEERGDDADDPARRAADEAEQHRLGQELDLDGLLGRADGDAHADLARPLRDGDEHHVHDADPADDERDRGDGDEQQRQRAARFELGLDDVLRIADVEVVVLLGTEMVAVAQQRRGLLPGELDDVGRDGGAEDVVEPGDAHQLFLRGGVRQDDGVVLVLAGHRQPFRRERRHDFARHGFHAHDFADRILGAEEVVAHGLAEDADGGGALDVVLRERRALRDRPSLDIKVFGRDAAERAEPVLVAVDDLRGSVDVRRDALDQRDLVLDGDGVAEGERLRAARAGADAVDRAAAGLDPDEVVAEVVELLLDARLPGFADGHDADHRGDADGDAEDGEHAAHLVAQQRPGGGGEDGEIVHPRLSLSWCHASPRLRSASFCHAVARADRRGAPRLEEL